tara:strand:- start:94 stop:480 length:387 start_codon:yes stop_codon:yes gene_type:complete
MNLGNGIKQILFFCIVFLIMFFSNSSKIFADETEWLEVSKTNNEILLINPNSIKYNNKGFLSVIAKYSEINPDDQKLINTDSYLMAIDCEQRLFSKLPENAVINQVKNWENPINNKFIKTTIINTCSY